MTLPIVNPRKSDKWIPYYLIPFFGVIAIVNAFFIYTALHSYTGVVTEDSYEHGLAYNKTLSEAATEKALNLHQKAIFKDGTLTWTLHQKDGSALEKAKVTAHFIRAVQDGYDFDKELTDNGNGVYSVGVHAPLSGAWTAKLEATWDKNQHYTTTYRFVTP